jgi:hypothetical protein
VHTLFQAILVYKKSPVSVLISMDLKWYEF